MRILLLAAAALALFASGCRSNQERSAELERKALAEGKGKGADEGVQVKTPSRFVHVIGAVALHGKETDAVAITVRNGASKALHGMPIEFTVYGADGKQLYSNASGGLAPSLERLPTVPAHGELTWVDDQVTLGGPASRVSAKVGEGRPTDAAPLTVGAVRLVDEPEGETVESSLTSPGPETYSELVVYATATSGGRVVAAGRAIVSTVPPHKKTAVPQIFMVGSAKGARLSVLAPAP